MDASGGTGRGDAPQSAAEVWALFKETDRVIQEVAREHRKMIEDIKQRQEETARQMKETDKRLGSLGGRFGQMVEHLVAPGILGKFRELGYGFDEVSTRKKFTDKAGRAVAEADIWLENGSYALAVEVKADLSVEDVREHIARLVKIRAHLDAKGDGRKLLGAAAGAILEGNVQVYAVRQGLFVLGQTGDTVRIEVPEGFTPCEW
ncbi:MAG: hypothetical protein LBT74_05020 [Acidobacteriota bacterium]|nr:hypothetical protein [Acidobacteriota bacterium]